jgi:hypothetical protein
MALKRIEECRGQIRIGQLARDCQVTTHLTNDRRPVLR